MKGSNIDWNWRYAAFGAVMAIGAALLTLNGFVREGLGLLIGSIPAAMTGLAPKRNQRKPVLIVGLLFSISILLGSLLALWVPLAIAGMFILGRRAALSAAEKPFGLAALSVCMPLTAIGLTYTGVADSIVIVVLFALGAIGSYLWAMVLPEYEGTNKPGELLKTEDAKKYSISLSWAAGLSTAIGFMIGVEYVGWLVGSTMLVMRPAKEMLRLRSIGRTVSVFIGALLAGWLLTVELSLPAAAFISSSVLIMMAATSKSRWYVTPAFTSFLILWALLWGVAPQEEIVATFGIRVLNTLIGVAVAYVAGALVPALAVDRKK